jgi:predicted Zn-dependent protease
MELKGYYLDGKTADRKDAVVRVEPAGLAIDLPGGGRLSWTYAAIRQNRDSSNPDQVVLEKGGPIPETLVVPREPFSLALRALFPASVRPFTGLAPRPGRRAQFVFSGLGLAVLLVSLYLWGIPLLSALAASRVPVAWEESLGRSVVESLAPARMRCSETDQALFLQEIVEALSAPLPERPYTFRVVVLDSPEVNALAVPGGGIVVFRGLLEKAETPEELAGVLAHEMQHILHRHSTRMLLENASLGFLLGVILGDAGSAAGIGKEGAGLLGTLRYGRQFEEQADEEGMRLLLAAGVNPGGLISFFEKIEKEEGRTAGIPAYFSTHPSPESRLKKLKLIADESGAKTFKPLARRDWEKIRKACGRNKRE